LRGITRRARRRSRRGGRASALRALPALGGRRLVRAALPDPAAPARVPAGGVRARSRRRGTPPAGGPARARRARGPDRRRRDLLPLPRPAAAPGAGRGRAARGRRAVRARTRLGRGGGGSQRRMKRLEVVVLNWNGLEDTRALLASLEHCRAPAGWEVRTRVVDN